MEKRTLLKALLLLLLLALIVNVNFLSSPETADLKSVNAGNLSLSLESASANAAEPKESPSSSVIPDAGSHPASSECLDKFNLSESTIIFYYTDEIHSNSMQPIVRELESSHDFFWNSNVWDEEFNRCFGYSEGTFPAFVCAGTKIRLVGEVSKAQLDSFANSC